MRRERTLERNLVNIDLQKGNRAIIGTGIPSRDIGNDGDTFVSTDTLQKFEKFQGDWYNLGITLVKVN